MRTLQPRYGLKVAPHPAGDATVMQRGIELGGDGVVTRTRTCR
ncbi:hypothetical protein ACFY2R_04635 [Micromonospora olivasterospora]|uniref:Glycerophosphoryl diester phosphodiesterase n=1 Tax=Micromonospora olivasterospora TaxID=1880 RepID=A0A562IEC6_MICOL|nr:hypothetical protein [Micromonospora olivasterospora]TWH69158.1 hypothetical protein JD77_04165 [Micromonospora olivasterospora]